MKPYEISDEILNAFIDDEIDSAEKIEILRQLGGNPELTQRACELVRTKELVRAAYQSALPDSAPSSQRVSKSMMGAKGWGALAASLLVAVVFLGGVQTAPQRTAELIQLEEMSGDFSPVAFQQAEQDAAMRIVFHLTSSDPLRMGKLLDDVSVLLEQTSSLEQRSVVEVIANGDGLGMFRSDMSGFGEQIHEMRAANPNLRFVACQRTIDQLESDGVGKVHLLPDVVRAGSGISRVIQRQQQGWSYIQI